MEWGERERERERELQELFDVSEKVKRIARQTDMQENRPSGHIPSGRSFSKQQTALNRPTIGSCFELQSPACWTRFYIGHDRLQIIVETTNDAKGKYPGSDLA